MLTQTEAVCNSIEISQSGPWCDDIYASGGLCHLGEQCWCSCSAGCGIYSCNGINIVTMGYQKDDGCIWPTNSKLGCVAEFQGDGSGWGVNRTLMAIIDEANNATMNAKAA